MNGDVDNFADLKAAHGLRIRPEITTDAKVIPTLTSRQLAAGVPLVEAFRRAVAAMEGSVAIAAQSASHPEALLLGLRGSGQALYVGVAEDLTMVASEPYGLVEVCDRYLRIDGDNPGRSRQPGRQPRPDPPARRHPRRHARRPPSAGPTTGPSCRSQPASW